MHKHHFEIPIATAHLFPVLDKLLLELLSSLSPEEWQSPTIAKLWTVKDIAAHLLDGNLRTLSASRDQFFGETAANIHTYADLVAYLNQLNGTWVNACKRLSPAVILHLLKSSGQPFCAHMAALPPFEPAVFSVAWAGQKQSLNWFHIAREYTEKFIHQQQIRDAVGKQALFNKELFYPFIATSMYALPHTFKNVDAPIGTGINVIISTEIGGDFSIVKTDLNWELKDHLQTNAAASVVMDPDTAWKLFSKGISAQQAQPHIQITGDDILGERVLNMVAVMA